MPIPLAAIIANAGRAAAGAASRVGSAVASADSAVLSKARGLFGGSGGSAAKTIELKTTATGVVDTATSAQSVASNATTAVSSGPTARPVDPNSNVKFPAVPGSPSANSMGTPPPPPIDNRKVAGGMDDGSKKGPNPSNFTPQEKSQISGIVNMAKGILSEGSRAVKETIGLPFESGAKALDKGRSVVNNDMVGLVEQLDMLPDGVKKFVRSLDNLTNAIEDRGQYLARFNGNLALKSAEAGVRKLRSEINEANYVGESYGKVIESKSKLDEQVMDFFNPIKDGIAMLANDGLEIMRGILIIAKQYVQPFLIIMVELVRALIQAVATNTSKTIEILEGIPKKIAKSRGAIESEEKFINDLFDNAARSNNARIERKAPDVFAPGVIGVN